MKKLEIVSDFISRVDIETLDRWQIEEVAENIVTLCDLDFDEYQTKTLAAALDAGLDAEEIVNGIIEGGYRLYENVRTYEDFGEEILLDKLQGDRFLEHIAPFIDYERYGQMYCVNNCCYFTKYGVLETF